MSFMRLKYLKQAREIMALSIEVMEKGFEKRLEERKDKLNKLDDKIDQIEMGGG